MYFLNAKHAALFISSTFHATFYISLFHFTCLFLSVNDFLMFLLPLDVKLSILDSSQSRICVHDLYRIGNQSALQKNDINACDMSRFRFFKQRTFRIYHILFIFYVHIVSLSVNIYKNNIFKFSISGKILSRVRYCEMLGSSFSKYQVHLLKEPLNI